VNLVHAGEIGGILDTILQRLAVYIEKRVKLRGRSAARSSTRSPRLASPSASSWCS
jgi:type II secretory pathway component PulF